MSSLNNILRKVMPKRKFFGGKNCALNGSKKGKKTQNYFIVP
jgi:hypothetical protein